MFKIGDFSKLNKIPIKTLRYYDELGLLKPAKIDEQTGYRFYSAMQLPRLNKILALKDLGFSLSKINEIIDNNVTKEVLCSMLNSRKEEIRKNIILEKEKLSRVERIINSISEEADSIMSKYDIVIKEAEAIKIASIRDIIPSYSEQHGLWKELGEYIEKNNAKITPPCVVIYYDQGFKENNVDIEICEHFTGNLSGNERIKIKTLQAVKQMACTVHQGSYEKLSIAYTALMKWIEDNGYEIVGPNRELYLEGEWSVKNPEEYITEIQIPVSK
ncbi:MerR family transcriptional regulator [Clostridium sp. 19966]|uniref:MerR family transcriptional regulator n=1 Tax=Clostridium sp. 19966 TaxID=2768166 RepID=UPI0028E03ABC|nr:MerR family transcriptional regulator [Clostridium sp. 19966]MDT8718761.1 MerR family transcriptional regulator [Clostridium sp. 19966]